ncbi:bestrophin-4-like [Uranotaenia lowii]|uniref:bestrophin-4-like n=1 Tax=Uranotaenia lowii TaxID=190385 RepID=UPI00247A62D4|nr:bestrophin-4-like [Uranotaenia lowii]
MRIKITFESIVKYCKTYLKLIPLSFILGFYVASVMKRWWKQYRTIPWPDGIAVFVSADIHGQDERGRVMRRTIMRYVCLCLTMVFANISPRVKKRFPTKKHFIEAGLLNENEYLIMDELDNNFPKYPKHWMPIVWAASVVTRARKEGRIRDDYAVKTIIDELNVFRGQCGLLMSYDMISLPLVYTQVVTLAVYSYSLTSVISTQWVDARQVDGSDQIGNIEQYFPIFSTLEFFFYMGWLKVAESLINPFGEDDDDFELNWMVDRNLQVSYLIVDDMHHEHPMLVKDQYWDEGFPYELPHTVASAVRKEEPPQPSTAKIEVEWRLAEEDPSRERKISENTVRLIGVQGSSSAVASAGNMLRTSLKKVVTAGKRDIENLNAEELGSVSTEHFTTLAGQADSTSTLAGATSISQVVGDLVKEVSQITVEDRNQQAGETTRTENTALQTTSGFWESSNPSSLLMVNLIQSLATRAVGGSSGNNISEHRKTTDEKDDDADDLFEKIRQEREKTRREKRKTQFHRLLVDIADLQSGPVPSVSRTTTEDFKGLFQQDVSLFSARSVSETKHNISFESMSSALSDSTVT